MMCAPSTTTHYALFQRRSVADTMYIILMRHGEAEPETESVSNRNRALTPKGMRQVRRSARILSKFLKDNAIRIYTSPYYRTRQTAGILAEECFAEEIHTAEELTSTNWQMVLHHIISDGSPIALVSHHPFLQSYLLHTASSAIAFDLAGIAVIDYDLKWKQGKLVGYFTPSLRQLKKED